MPWHTPRSVFYHIPKTGGTWVRKAMRNAGLDPLRCNSTCRHVLLGTSNAHATPAMTFKDETRGRFSFCFIRDPVEWYPSMWSWIPHKSKPYDGLLGDYWSDDFETWVGMLLDAWPNGFVSELYSLYVNDVDFVGRTDRLEADLARALELAGETFKVKSLHDVPPQNVRMGPPVEMTPRLKLRIERAEKWAMERYHAL